MTALIEIIAVSESTQSLHTIKEAHGSTSGAMNIC